LWENSVRLSVVSFSRGILAAIYQWPYEVFFLPCNNSKKSERIFIKFDMHVATSEDTLNSYFLTSCNLLQQRDRRTKLQGGTLVVCDNVITHCAAIHQWQYKLSDNTTMSCDLKNTLRTSVNAVEFL
jgi:hypothetical protein